MNRVSRGRRPTAKERQEWEQFSRTTDQVPSHVRKARAEGARRPRKSIDSSGAALAKSARILSGNELDDWEAFLREEPSGEQAKTGDPVRSKPLGEGGLAAGTVRQDDRKAGFNGAAPSDSRRKPAISPVDRRLLRQLKAGRAAPESRIDLHGMTCAEAEHAVVQFVTEASRRKQRIVLVITGKGRINARAYSLGGRKGIIRELVPEWLGAPAFRGIVWHFEFAQPRHGGTGAFYVFLKRNRGDV